MQPLWCGEKHGAKLPVYLDCSLHQVEEGRSINGVVFSTLLLRGLEGFAQHGVEYANQLFRANVCA